MANSSFFRADSQTLYLLLGICLVTGLYVYNNKQGKLLRDMHIDKVEINSNHSLLGPLSNDPEVNATLQSKDYQRAVNPLLPPERTYPYGNPSIQEIHNRTPKLPINIPTRGESGTYSQVGILTAPDENNPTVLPYMVNLLIPVQIDGYTIQVQINYPQLRFHLKIKIKIVLVTKDVTKYKDKIK